MKASIITFHNEDNYGALLQAYALQHYLSRLVDEVEIIDYRPNTVDLGFISLRYKANASIPKEIQLLRALIKSMFCISLKKKAKRFVAEYLNVSPVVYKTSIDFECHPPSADIFIAGSDQIWNEEILGSFDPNYYLAFVKKGKKISYAASFGKDVIEKDELDRARHYLSSFDRISVRELDAQQKLAFAGVDNVQIVLDPVFLLEKSDYQNLLVEPAIKKYVYVYSSNNDPVSHKLARKLADHEGLVVVSGLGVKNSKFADYNIKNSSPGEFLGLLANANYVITNTFHGTAFSIIFNKQFSVVPHTTRNSRMNTILAHAGLENRFIIDISEWKKMTHYIDYEVVESRLKAWKERSRHFLQDAVSLARQ